MVTLHLSTPPPDIQQHFGTKLIDTRSYIANILVNPLLPRLFNSETVVRVRIDAHLTNSMMQNLRYDRAHGISPQ
ncbi:hypothetical protein N7495_008083 [Penicillium taxi]|uniref:uncharacterized protein n=1 Tax=Penicillium taxi TaxID=168475 RepID=UPI00254562A0|nr:uncharacterized protein N7495_008083 [Penicillium taxi]KAJ5888042.1 hypothetical protein N7495_008083 [Penicillium taxi]